MVDFFLLLMLPGSGDELQGIKRGIMEMADAIAVTKADGDNIRRAEQARTDFLNALHFYPPAESGWTPVVHTCSALTRNGLREIWEVILDYFSLVRSNDWFHKNRREQSAYWMHQTIEQGIKRDFYNNPDIIRNLKKLEKKVVSDELSAFTAAHQILSAYLSKKQ